MTTFEVKPSTREDLIEYLGDEVRNQTIRSLTVTLDGKIVGIGGLHLSLGVPLAFINMDESVKEVPGYKRTIIKCVRWVMRWLELSHKVAYTMPQNDEAHVFLTHFGFKHHADYQGEKIYKWHNSYQH